MTYFSRRDFLELLGASGVVASVRPVFAAAADAPSKLVAGTYHPGRIVNEYTLFLPGEKEALRTPPTVSAVGTDDVTAQHAGQTLQLHINDEIGGWRLVCIVPQDGGAIAVFEKHATHRGVIAFVDQHGIVTCIPKQIGQIASVRPRQINAKHGMVFKRLLTFQPGPDRLGQYILNSAEDPCYENIAALGPEYIGWTLVGNEEGGPQHSLYLDAGGFSRELAEHVPFMAAVKAYPWSPDKSGLAFDPTAFPVMPIMLMLLSQLYEYRTGYSKRSLLGGMLPVANLAVWNPTTKAGYEAIVMLPPGPDAVPVARMRYILPKDQIALAEQWDPKDPEAPEVTRMVGPNPPLLKDGGTTYIESFWNTTPTKFYATMLGVWKHWHEFHDSAMQVDIPDEWLRDAAQAGLTLTRCSYHGLEPTYQVGEGAYSDFKDAPSCKPGTDCPQVAYSVALFPVAHYAFIWAHQLWNHSDDSDRYFQYYLDNYILPNGDFTFNTQTQVEAPLNVGVFLANSARSYFYSHNLVNFEKRLPILERMIRFTLDRYEYSKAKYPPSDPRHGLIWGPPEADLGRVHANVPESYPYFYFANATWTWRGLVEHAAALRLAGHDSGRQDFVNSAAHYEQVAREMRPLIEAAIAKTRAMANPEMKAAGISPFRTDDIHRKPGEISSYENHRFIEDWFLSDWGDTTMDLGHLKHRDLSGHKTLGLPTGSNPSMPSNFMMHGTLSVLIRQEDYRPFLLTLYAMTCYTSDSGNRYSPEDALVPGGHPLEGVSGAWGAVVTSTLQATMGLRWLLCYEETHSDVCHLQKGAPKHWFAAGRTITVQNCPTRFGTIGWTTEALSDRHWKIAVDVPKGFGADLVIHVHPNDEKPLRSVSLGTLKSAKIVLPKELLHSGARRIELTVS